MQYYNAFRVEERKMMDRKMKYASAVEEGV
jgi:RNA-binding protein YlmH